MKRLLIIILVLISFAARSQQTQVQAKRGVFTERLFLKDRWIDRISTDLNTSDSTQDNLLPTGKAIADFVRPKAGNYIRNQFSTAQPANLFIQGQALMGSHNSFRSGLISGLPAQVNITQNSNQHGLSVQRSSNDKGPASIVLFKNRGADFNSVNGLLPGDTIGSISFSGVAGNNNVVNVMSMHSMVEETDPEYLKGGLVFNTTDTSGSYGQRVWLNADGGLLLGNSTTNPYMLNVENGDVRFSSLAGSGDVLVGADYNGKMVKLNLNENLYIENGVLHARVPGIVKVEKYIAVLSQSGQANPAGIVHQNSIGSITWTRTAPGIYTGTITDGSLSNDLALHAEASDTAGNVFSARLVATNNNTLTLIIKDSNLVNMDGWTNISIEVKSYPPPIK
jgi:hypothetical protein